MRDEWVRNSETDPILVDFLPDDEVRTPGRLGMTFAPGMRTTSLSGRWERNLAADLQALEEEYEINVLVSLMEDHEYHGYRIPQLLEKDRLGGIEMLRFAIEDMSVPREAESEMFESFVQDIVGRLEQGQNIVVHCRGGLGRTGTVAACVLIALGHHSADEAIAAVREARKGTVQTRARGLRAHLRGDGPGSGRLERGLTMTVTPPHLQALEEIEPNGILGLVEILREEGIDAARYALWDATGWHRELPRRLGWLQSGSWNDWS